jgi:hypothetical protein
VHVVGEAAIKCYGECFQTAVNVIVLSQAASWLLPQHRLTKINQNQQNTKSRSYLMLTRTKIQTKASKQKAVFVHYDLLQPAMQFFSAFNNIHSHIGPCPLIPLTLNPECNYFALVNNNDNNNNTTTTTTTTT